MSHAGSWRALFFGLEGRIDPPPNGGIRSRVEARVAVEKGFIRTLCTRGWSIRVPCCPVALIKTMGVRK